MKINNIDKLSASTISAINVIKNEKLAELLQFQISLLRKNQFLTVFDIHINDYIHHHNIENVIGYAPSEFTDAAFNNRHLSDPAVPISHPILYEQDKQHFERFSFLLYNLISSPQISIKQFEDSACLKFRLYKKNKTLVLCDYLTFCGDIDDSGRFRYHIDIWTIHPIIKGQTFIPSAQFYHPSDQQKANIILNKVQQSLYEFHLTNKEILVFTALKKGLLRKEIAKQFNVSEGTINTHFNNIKNKVDNFLMKNQISPTTNFIELSYYIELYNICGY